MRHRTPHYPIVLGCFYLLLFALTAINPHDRADWALESVLPVLSLAVLVVTYRWFRFSSLSYTLMFLYLVLHAVGAYFTYTGVPYDAACRTLFGWSPSEAFGWQRNHYDRLVHLCFGLLLAYPLFELLRRAGVRRLWCCLLPIEIVLSTSALYELIEWAAALLFGGDLGTAYLGTQGDPWDAQKDIALAAAGAVVAMAVTVAVHAVRARLGRRHPSHHHQTWRVHMPVTSNWPRGWRQQMPGE